MKNLNIFVVFGLIGSVLIIWNRLRSRFPQEVPIEFNNIVIEIIFKTLPLILLIIFLIKIKHLVYPQESSRIAQKIYEVCEKPIGLFKKVEKDFFAEYAKYFYENPRVMNLILRSFNYAMLKNSKIILETGFTFGNIYISKRYNQFILSSKVILLFPQILFYIVGIVEMYFIGELIYFYSLLPLLLLPLLWKSYLCVLDEYYAFQTKEDPSYKKIWCIEEDRFPPNVRAVEDLLPYLKPEDLDKFEIIPLAEPYLSLSKPFLEKMQNSFKYHNAGNWLCTAIRRKNNETLSEFSNVFLILKILFLVGLFYPLPPIYSIDLTLIASFWLQG